MYRDGKNIKGKQQDDGPSIKGHKCTAQPERAKGRGGSTNLEVSGAAPPNGRAEQMDGCSYTDEDLSSPCACGIRYQVLLLRLEVESRAAAEKNGGRGARERIMQSYPWSTHGCRLALAPPFCGQRWRHVRTPAGATRGGAVASERGIVRTRFAQGWGWC